MGMYDHITCNVDIPHKGIEMQTKDLNCELLNYTIEDDGLYQATELEEGSWGTKHIEPPRRIEYTGLLSFYTTRNDEWIEYWALVDHGDVLWIMDTNKNKYYQKINSED